MATKGEKKGTYEANAIFLQYEEEMAESPAYQGMPDLRHEDGSIQWEAPSNRTGGEFKDSHDKRLAWWRNKAREIGIDINEDHWISKVAKQIHPTGKKPCKKCGRIMDIRYCYLSNNFIKRVHHCSEKSLELDLDETTHVLDFLPMFVDLLGDEAYEKLPVLFVCTQIPSIPDIPRTLEAWEEWIENEYIPKEPSMLGPGAMSNAPDRFDGFHSFNRCCRKTADKGRSKENLASYSTDRRAFENWVDGNWITANKLMGFINSNTKLKLEHCLNETSKPHPRPCSADHIGPVSLGFCHRPEFQLLCMPCNSSKNNRMYFSDVQHLIQCELHGETIVSWYAKPVWDLCKGKVTNAADALKLSMVMRDNRNVAMMLLFQLLDRGEFLFLYSFLNLELANFDYQLVEDTVKINNHIVTVNFTKKESQLKYVTSQKVRKVRVAFSSLAEYASKENRNGFTFSNAQTEKIFDEILSILSEKTDELKEQNMKLKRALLNENESLAELSSFIEATCYESLETNTRFNVAKDKLKEIMRLVGMELEKNWNDARYSRNEFD